jgi:GNAT superfamily N-acetyltransferase
MELGLLRAVSYLGGDAGWTMAVSQRVPAISIRRAMIEDAPQILACLRAAFEDYCQLYTPDAFLDTVLTPETIQERLAKMLVFAAIDDSNEVVGTIACSVISAEEGHLRGMAVLPSLRGKGIAAQLLSHAEAELRELKCTRITLDTTAPLQRAMRFYEKFGYRRSRKVTDFFGMPLIEYHKVL